MQRFSCYSLQRGKKYLNENFAHLFLTCVFLINTVLNDVTYKSKSKLAQALSANAVFIC